MTASGLHRSVARATDPDARVGRQPGPVGDRDVARPRGRRRRLHPVLRAARPAATSAAPRTPTSPRSSPSAPDLVVLDEEENRREDADALQAAGVALLVTAVRSVDDALAAVEQLARATGRPVPAAAGAAAAAAGATDRLRADLAAAVDVAQRRHLRRVGAGRARRRPRDGGRARTATRPSTSTTSPPGGPTSCSCRASRTPSPTPTSTSWPAGWRRPAVRRVDGQDLFWWGIRTRPALDRLSAATAPR